MTAETLARIRRNALAVIIPPPKMKLSQWIESHVHLPEGVSALPGPVRLWPYQHEIADAIGDPEFERVTLVKPVRVGFTTLLTGAVASFVANDPSPILALLPTEADCRDYVVSDIEPIFAASPNLEGILGSGSDETHRNTILHRRFAGGSLKIVAAKAPRNLRRHNVRILLCDEVDGMEVGAEGSPLLLAERRTLSFANRKIVIGSTPIFEETSPVLRSYAQSDQRIFEVPCPDCGVFSEIRWNHIEWPENQPEKAAYRCPECAELISERHKPQMVADALWRALCPDVKGHAGFRLNALVSLLANASWGRLAVEFIAAKRDPADLQVFVNTILAEGWKLDGEVLDENELASRAEPFGLDAIPVEILCITAGCDVQHDRVEITFVGWTREGETIILGHTVAWGMHDDDTTWLEVDEILKTRWQHPLGGRIKIDAAVIDCGDGATMETVTQFCFARYGRKILAGKGVAGTRPWIEVSKSKQRGGRIWLVGVDGIKSAIMTRLSHGRTIRFSADLAPVWYEQLASERVVIRYSRGQPQRRFERIPGREAEALDCLVYAMAARQVCNVNWDQRADNLRRGVDDQEAKIDTVIRSKWLR